MFPMSLKSDHLPNHSKIIINDRVSNWNTAFAGTSVIDNDLATPTAEGLCFLSFYILADQTFRTDCSHGGMC